MESADTLRARLIAQLRAADVDYRTIRHAPAVGSLRVAARRGMPASAGAKSLVMRAAGEFLLIVIPGDRRLSSPKLRRALGTHDIRMGLFGLPVVMDRRLTANETVAFTAGRTDESFVLRAADLVRLVQPRLVEITRDAPE
jgi:prolyl-tRNA editing enzyme YbaK/EbsC (Cys-tRNA(Pro) deacylase)